MHKPPGFLDGLRFMEYTRSMGGATMAGLAKGYDIPRFQVGKHNSSTVRDGLSGGSAHLPNGRPCHGICHP